MKHSHLLAAKLTSWRTFCLAFLLLFAFSCASYSQIDVFETRSKVSPERKRKRGLMMLREVREAVEKYYYDKSFHGLNLDEKFKTAEEQIKTLETNSDIFRVIAATVLELGDSHTVFYPPGRANVIEYGFTTQMVGNACVVTDVQKGSDAEKKGLKPGDVIAAFGRFDVTRNNLWEINYNLYYLSPMTQLPISVLNADGSRRDLVIESSIKTIEQRRAEAEKRRKEKRENPYKCQRIDQETVACRLETFMVEKQHIDKMMAEASAAKKLILDLRGNGGGYVEVDKYLLGHFFDHDVKVASVISRKGTKDEIAPTREKRAFRGDLIVLVDSRSASASEVFARTIQLQKRGKVVGDVTAGAVMTSWGLSLSLDTGYSSFIPYGLNVSVADLIMSDGQRLEGIGVMPDHPVGPTRAAWLQRTDPVLAYAANLLGAKLTPADAGKFHFFKSRYENDQDEDADDNSPDSAGN